MPKWIEKRKEHILARNPEMDESTAWAIATQQSHALGKSPKGYGTAEGRREAKAKYDTPKDDMKKADPGKLTASKMSSMRQGLEDLFDKEAGVTQFLSSLLPAAKATASPSSARLMGTGTTTQMLKGRNFGAPPRTDPFVAMRAQQARVVPPSGIELAAPVRR